MTCTWARHKMWDALAAVLWVLLLSTTSRITGQEIEEWQRRFVSTSDPFVGGQLLADYICAAQGMKLDPPTPEMFVYSCTDPGIVPIAPLEIEVGSDIALNGLRLPPLDTGKIWIHAVGCVDGSKPPQPCDPSQSFFSVHAIGPDCTYCGDNNKFEIDTSSICIACSPLYRDPYSSTPFFVRGDAELRIDGLQFMGSRTQTRGGVFLIWSSALVQLNYVHFFNNKAKLDGGALAIGEDGSLELYRVTFDENYIFPTDRLFTVVLNDYWIDTGGYVMGVEDVHMVEGCLDCGNSFSPPLPPSPPPISPPPPPSPPLPPLAPGEATAETGEIIGGGLLRDPNSTNDGNSTTDGLTEEEMQDAIKQSESYTRIVLYIGFGLGGLATISVLMCIAGGFMLRARYLQRKVAETVAVARRNHRENHHAEMVAMYGKTVKPATFTLSGMKTRQATEKVIGRLTYGHENTRLPRKGTSPMHSHQQTAKIDSADGDPDVEKPPRSLKPAKVAPLPIGPGAAASALRGKSKKKITTSNSPLVPPSALDSPGPTVQPRRPAGAWMELEAEGETSALLPKGGTTQKKSTGGVKFTD